MTELMTTHTSNGNFYLWYNTEKGKLVSGYREALIMDCESCQNFKSIKVLCKTSNTEWAIQVFREMAEDEQLTQGINAESFGLTEEWDAVF